MRAVALILTLALGILIVPLAAAAQQAGKVYRIGYLSTSCPSSSRFVEAFREGLRELGYVEGQKIAIEFRCGEGKIERLPDLAAELVRLKVDLIVAVATPGAGAAKQVTTTIPIVMVGVGDPVGLGYVASLARPGGNMTGLSSLTVDLGPKRLELLKESIPRILRVSVLWNPDDPARVLEFKETRGVAERFGLRLQSIEVRSRDEIERAFSAMAKERPDALIVQQDPLTITQRGRIAELAAKSRLPAIGSFREFPEAGGLMAYGANLVDMHRRAATFVDKILKGAKPADLPVEQPTKFELVINLKTAKALGLTIPQSVLIRADEVIQ